MSNSIPQQNGNGSPRRVYSGRAVACSRAPTAVRVERAVRHAHGEVEVTDLTVTQRAAIWHVPPSALSKALRNGNSAIHRSPTDLFLRRWHALGRSERAQVLAAISADASGDVR